MATSDPVHSPIARFFVAPTVRRDALIVILTVVTGITDAVGFIRLGGVFTSVMTGNMVLIGVNAGKGDGAGVIHTGVAFAAYVIGGILGAKIAGQPAKDNKIWPRTFTMALIVEFAAFVLFNAIFESMGGVPAGNDTYALLAINAVALGIQSAAVLRLGVSGLSTTYLTGTLTTVIARLHRNRPFEGSGRSILVLTALIVGALMGGVVALHIPRAIPLLQLGLLAVVIGGGVAYFWRDETGSAHADGERSAEPLS